MKHKLPIEFVSLIVLTLFLSANSTVFAQGDNPRVDAFTIGVDTEYQLFRFRTGCNYHPGWIR